MRFQEAKDNVHFWLRKIFLFVWLVEPNQDPITIVTRINELEKDLEQEILDKLNNKDLGEEDEQELRARLANKKMLKDYNATEISQNEALEACEKLYKLLREPFEPAKQSSKQDPACEGGLPRRRI